VSTTAFTSLSVTASRRYAPSMDCSVTVYSPDGGAVALTFTAFDTQMNEDGEWGGVCSKVGGRCHAWRHTRMHGMACDCLPLLHAVVVVTDASGAAGSGLLAWYSGAQGTGQRVAASTGGCHARARSHFRSQRPPTKPHLRAIDAHPSFPRTLLLNWRTHT
jgi:hypothetical protein